MVIRSSKGHLAAPLLALFCVCALIIAAFAVSIHNHDSSQEGTCLICHATERASVVAIDSDAGKPHAAHSSQVPDAPKPLSAPDAPILARTPRAPPSTLL